MQLSPKQRHRLLMAVRVRDAAWVAAVIEDVVAENPETALLEIDQEFRITVAKQTLSRELRAMGYRKLSARPVIMRKPKEPSRILKKVPNAPG